MERNLFRDEAVKQLTSPDQLDQRMKLAHRREWFALAAALLVVASVLAWSWLGAVETRALGSGMILRQGGMVRISSPSAGTELEYTINAGETVEADGLLATYQAADGSTVEVRNRYDEPVRVLELLVDFDQQFIAGTLLTLVEFIDRPLDTLAYLSSVSGSQVEPGMRVRVVLYSFPEQQYGFIEGTVVRVAPFPATSARLMAMLTDEAMVQTVIAVAGVGPTEIVIDLDEDPNSPSGFKWSSSGGPEIQLTSGLLAQVEIVIEKQRPISLVFP